MEEAMFAAGCFWGVEETFRHIQGVISTAVGYSGGSTENPTYEQVCTGKTGHAEVLHIKFNPQEVEYERLLEAFWNCHDPTTLNRQGPDIGSQYRSALFYYSPSQEASAHKSLENLEKTGQFSQPIVTEISPAAPFYRAEEYHQQYLAKRGGGSCRF